MKEEVTREEKSILTICRLNRLFPKNEIRKKFELGRFAVGFNWRSKDSLMGRFGGGWNWILGIQIGSTTTIINLLVCSLRFYWRKKNND